MLSHRFTFFTPSNDSLCFEAGLSSVFLANRVKIAFSFIGASQFYFCFFSLLLRLEIDEYDSGHDYFYRSFNQCYAVPWWYNKIKTTNKVPSNSSLGSNYSYSSFTHILDLNSVERHRLSSGAVPIKLFFSSYSFFWY